MKSYTDIEQSKKLTEILSFESADMCYLSDESLFPKVNYNGMVFFNSEEEKPSTIIPCWSLAALLSVLPQFIEFKGDKYYLKFMKEYVEYANDEVSITSRCLHTTGNDNLVDACYEMIIKLHEQKFL